MESCKENVRRNVRYVIDLRAVRIWRSELEEFVWRNAEVFDRVGSCKENVRSL